MSFNFYLSQPKSILETTLIKTLDKNPNLLKVLHGEKTPYYSHFLLKPYGFIIKAHNNELVFITRDD